MIKEVLVSDLINSFEISSDYLYLDHKFSGIEVDSRRCETQNMFVALKGENVDGHSFIEKVIEKGNKVFLIEESFLLKNIALVENWHKEKKCSFLAVQDVLKSMQDFATWHLAKFKDLTKIAITGSNGKTTTKELLAAVVQSKYKVSYTNGNFNSEIGLPIVVFNTDDESEVAIFEMGINRIGEMNILSNIVKPDIAVITNIGEAHIGMFGSLDVTANEKGAVFSNFSEQCDGYLFEDEKYFESITSKYVGNFHKYGLNINENIQVLEDKKSEGWLLSIDNIPFQVELFGKHNLNNICAVISIAMKLDIESSLIAQALSGIKAVSGRGIAEDGDCMIFDDCYNSNPDSMKVAINFFSDLDLKRRKIFVMGSMMELGEMSDKLHEQVARQLSESNIDIVIFTGKNTKSGYSKNNNSKSYYFEELSQLKTFLKDFKQTGDVFYLKGSRSIGLENLKEVLR